MTAYVKMTCDKLCAYMHVLGIMDTAKVIRIQFVKFPPRLIYFRSKSFSMS